MMYQLMNFMADKMSISHIRPLPLMHIDLQPLPEPKVGDALLSKLWTPKPTS